MHVIIPIKIHMYISVYSHGRIQLLGLFSLLLASSVKHQSPQSPFTARFLPNLKISAIKYVSKYISKVYQL